jgi:cytochrome o ubiquinol oxidase subunit IV
MLCAVLACARYRMGRDLLGRLSPGECGMSDIHGSPNQTDLAPGEDEVVSVKLRVLGYLVGLGLAILLTATSFFVAGTNLVWQPSIPVAIIVLAIAQMGVHLVFFLHITTGPDNTNNVLALAFGLLIVFLVIGGSLWIMAHLNQNMMPMDQLMQMQR